MSSSDAVFAGVPFWVALTGTAFDCIVLLGGYFLFPYLVQRFKRLNSTGRHLSVELVMEIMLYLFPSTVFWSLACLWVAHMVENTVAGYLFLCLPGVYFLVMLLFICSTRNDFTNMLDAEGRNVMLSSGLPKMSEMPASRLAYAHHLHDMAVRDLDEGSDSSASVSSI